MASPVVYVPTPTALSFHNDKSEVRLAMGPLGCGKSFAMCMEIFKLMAQQEKSPDGFRRTRTVIIRESYPMLTTTTLKTWKDIFPVPQTGRIVHGSPIVHYFEFGDIKAEVIFLSIENDSDIKKLMSLECTFVWINECRFSLKEILIQAKGRTGRYPVKVNHGADPTRSCVIMDTNPPDDDHWIYKTFEEEEIPGFSIHHYPPALIGTKTDELGLVWKMNPLAENINNLGEGEKYYLKQVNGPSEEWIRVYLCGEYGTTMDGRPVYSEYNDSVHFRPNLKPVSGIPINLAWDFGLTPCCVISQLLPNGQLIIIEEIVTDYMGITSFIVNYVKPLLSNEYGNFEIGVSVGDPAGSADMGGTLNARQTCFTILQDHGIYTIPAKTNKFLPRRESVARRLTTMVDGNPSLLIGPKAPRTRKGFKGAYHYKKLNIAVGKGETRFKEEPDKDMHSHTQDAVQYKCLQFDNFKAPNSHSQLAEIKQQVGFNSTPRRY